MPSTPRSPVESTAIVANGVGSRTPFLITRMEPSCWVTKIRPSGACANAAEAVRPVIQASLTVKPLGCVTPPANCTSAVDQAETLPAASLARARSTCWPLV